MQKLIFSIGLWMALGMGCLWSQTYTLSGRVSDDAGEPLGAASVMLLQAKDSLLQSFAVTNADGTFKFENVPAGKYVFKAMFLKHVTFVSVVDVAGENASIALPEAKMTPEATKVEEVQITDERIPIRMKGDTIEYDAKAFTTQQGDVVEELFKKLPGMEVDRDGNIKAQGKEVTRILVDGKEFFGDDPKVASKNLPAGAVDKVQVFDKRSEMADFTGIDDGTRDRTINLTLKDEYKKGYFGTVMGGYGSQDRFEGKASLSRFAEKSQISFLGQANNTNQQGFSFQDYANFMGGMRNMTRETGPNQMMGMSLNSNVASGFTTTGAGGLNGNWDLSKKTRLTASYFYNYMRKDLDRQAWKQTILDDGNYLTTEDGTQRDINQNNRANLLFRSDIDSLTRLTFRASGSMNTTSSESNNLTANEIPGGISNSSDINSLTEGGIRNLNSSFNLMHRYKKRGRASVLQGNFTLNPQDRDVDLSSINAFRASDTMPAFIDTLRQNQVQTQEAMTVGGSFSQSEPLGKISVLDGTVAFSRTYNVLDKDFFDLEADGQNPIQNLLLSNGYNSTFTYGRAGLKWRMFIKDFNLDAGVAFQRSQLNGLVSVGNARIVKDFANVLPSLEIRMVPGKSQRMTLRYTTRVNEPSITQLQPVPDNSNPLSLQLGNPDLRSEYAHSGMFNYNFFDQFSFTSFFASFGSTYTRNKISSLTTVDSLLRQVTQPVNVDHDLGLNANFNFSTPLRKLHTKVTLNGTSTYNRSIVYINGVENFVNRYTEGGDVRIENKTKTHFDASVGARTSYTLSKYPDASDFDQSYVNSGLFGEVAVFLPKRITLMTGLDCSVYAGAGFNSNQVVPLWRAYVSKKIFKNGRGELKVAAYDLLNRNIGITRTAQLNYQQEESVNTLSRYVIGSFTYSIVAVGKKL